MEVFILQHRRSFFNQIKWTPNLKSIINFVVEMLIDKLWKWCPDTYLTFLSVLPTELEWEHLEEHWFPPSPSSLSDSFSSSLLRLNSLGMAHEVCLSICTDFRQAVLLPTVHHAPSTQNRGPTSSFEWPGGLIPTVIYPFNTLVLHFN